jgi:hypothetical protein
MALNPRREHKDSGTKCNGFGVLRAILENACETVGCGLGDLTVLSAQVDPYRLDTPSGHRDGSWVAKHFNRVIKRGKDIHWRGLHYALVSSTNLTKPNGDLYQNTHEDWTWLVNVAGKTARWLGYIDFDRITDNRNFPPFIFHKASIEPKALVSIGIDGAIPNAEDLEPTPIAKGFEPRADCDPAGHQMPVSIGRKLQAFRDKLFPALRRRTAAGPGRRMFNCTVRSEKSAS